MVPYALDIKTNPDNWDNTYKTILPIEPRLRVRIKYIDTLFEKYKYLHTIGKFPIDAYKKRDIITKEKQVLHFSFLKKLYQPHEIKKQKPTKPHNKLIIRDYRLSFFRKKPSLNLEIINKKQIA